MVELAVFGSLLLVVLGGLIRFGLAATYSQQLEQDSFRKALATPSGSVSYTLVEDRLVPGAGGGAFPLSSRSRVVGTAQVLWDVDLFTEGDDTSAMMEINGRIVGDVTEGLTADSAQEVVVEGRLIRDEDAEGITTTDTLSQTHTITSTVGTGGGNIPVVSELTRSRTITTTTPFDE